MPYNPTIEGKRDKREQDRHDHGQEGVAGEGGGSSSSASARRRWRAGLLARRIFGHVGFEEAGRGHVDDGGDAQDPRLWCGSALRRDLFIHLRQILDRVLDRPEPVVAKANAACLATTRSECTTLREAMSAT